MILHECPLCGGDGKETCNLCEGTGMIDKDTTMADNEFRMLVEKLKYEMTPEQKLLADLLKIELDKNDYNEMNNMDDFNKK